MPTLNKRILDQAKVALRSMQREKSTCYFILSTDFKTIEYTFVLDHNYFGPGVSVFNHGNCLITLAYNLLEDEEAK